MIQSLWLYNFSSRSDNIVYVSLLKRLNVRNPLLLFPIIDGKQSIELAEKPTFFFSVSKNEQVQILSEANFASVKVY
jgi:hypothetical protein